MKNTIKGNFRRTIYKTDKGYIVGLFKVKEVDNEELEFYINHTITFTGYFHELNEDDVYIFNGCLVKHDKYGEQFQVESYERCQKELQPIIQEQNSQIQEQSSQIQYLSEQLKQLQQELEQLKSKK